MTKGYLYIAFGEKYIQEALVSSQSLIKVDPSAKISLVTNEKLKSDNMFDHIIILNEYLEKPYLYKVKALNLSPYEYTFFIDTDTYFCEGCSELFDLLNYFDLLISPCNNDYLTVFNKESKPINGIYAYNTGVIVFKKNKRTSDFLLSWYNVYINHFDMYIHDQGPFMEALLNEDIKILVLQTMYNARTPYPFNMIAKPVKIIHGRHNDYKAIADKLNRNSHQSRIWFPRLKIVLTYRRTKLFKWYMRLDQKYKDHIKSIIKPLVIRLGMRDYI
jgi:hypothetical protein